MIDELTECYRLLDLAPGASVDEVKRSYRELVKVWHPDRFSADPKLQAKAQEKLKQINSAYERLRNAQAYGPQQSSSRAGSKTSHAGEQQWTASRGGAKTNPGATRQNAPQQTPPSFSPPTPARATKWGRKVAILAIAVVVITVFKTRTATTRSDSSAEASTEETQEKVNNYDDFTNPTNLLRAPTWIGAPPEVRPQLVERAMRAFLKELDLKRDKKVGNDPVWTPAGSLTSKGEEFVARTRQMLRAAAQDPEGGLYRNTYSGRLEILPWVDEFMIKGHGPEAVPNGVR